MKSKLNKNGREEREVGGGEKERDRGRERERGRENSLMNCKCHVKASVQWRSRKKIKGPKFW